MDFAFGQLLHRIEQCCRYLIINNQNRCHISIQRQHQCMFRNLPGNDAMLCHIPVISQQNLDAAYLSADTAVDILNHMPCHQRRTISGAYFLCQHMSQRGFSHQCSGIRQCCGIIQIAAKLQTFQCN